MSKCCDCPRSTLHCIAEAGVCSAARFTHPTSCTLSHASRPFTLLLTQWPPSFKLSRIEPQCRHLSRALACLYMQRITSTLSQRLSPANAVADQYDACGSSECSALTASINQTNIAYVPPLLLHAILTRHAVQCPYRSASTLGINFTIYSNQNCCCCCFLYHYTRSHHMQSIDRGHTHLLITFVHKNTQVLHCVGRRHW